MPLYQYMHTAAASTTIFLTSIQYQVGIVHLLLIGAGQYLKPRITLYEEKLKSYKLVDFREYWLITMKQDRFLGRI